ncbi:MAG: CDP-alcohol phosphatidyltransferase family protein [Anaerolineales bacterium]|jgi:archaetidylinositol phosphate synthase
MADIETHSRVNDILLGPLERPTLKWLAEHMPAWVTPDILTGVGVFGAVVVLLGFWLVNSDRIFLWLASLGFVINWFGDSMDGTLARHRKAQRPKYGFFVDHTVDSFNEVLIFLGLGISPLMRFEIASVALIGYLLMSVLVFVRTCVVGEFKISYGKLGPTEVRAIAVGVNTLIYFFGNPAFQSPMGPLAFYDLVGIFVAALLFLIYIGATVRGAVELDKYGESSNK